MMNPHMPNSARLSAWDRDRRNCAKRPEDALSISGVVTDAERIRHLIVCLDEKVSGNAGNTLGLAGV